MGARVATGVCACRRKQVLLVCRAGHVLLLKHGQLVRDGASTLGQLGQILVRSVVVLLLQVLDP